MYDTHLLQALHLGVQITEWFWGKVIHSVDKQKKQDQQDKIG